jgi:hypothetical protein
MDWAAYLEVASLMHDLPIDPSRRDEVIAELERIEAFAKTVVDYPLSPEVEPAPIYRA